ncbi:MAG TPA: two-component regulator propeller domain-containing protein [Rhodothermales bacterium]|nr:two-component regulator propeller domain-containing protein [Rhodothermales bacterium]
MSGQLAPSRCRHIIIGLFGWLLAGLFTTCAVGQERPVFFDRLSVDDGLSQTIVTAMLQDRHGFLWIGTEGGLNRYDGYDILVYKQDQTDSTSLSHSFIHALLEDEQGFLWIGTYGGGLNRFDPETGTFSHFWHDPDDANSLSDDRVLTLLPREDGTFWMGTESGGLSHFEPATGTFTHYQHDPDDPNSLGHNEVRSIAHAPDGSLWIGLGLAGLNHFDPATSTFTRYRHDPANPNSLSDDEVTTLLTAADGTLWVGTGQGGLDHLDPATSTFTHYRHAAKANSLSNNAVADLLLDRQGLLWIATGDGLNALDPKSRHFTTYRHDTANPKSLSTDNLRVLFEDTSGLLWIGTWGSGLNKLRRTPFAVYRHHPEDPNSLTQNDVMNFVEEPSGALWIATYTGGINRFDRKTQTFQRFTTHPGRPGSLQNNASRRVYVDSNGTVWVASWGGGLHRYQAESGTFVVYQHDPNKPASLGSNQVSAFLETRAGNLWVGTFGAGPCRFDPATESFTCLTEMLDAATPLSGLNTYAMHEAPDGRIWISAWGFGIDVYDPATGTLTHHEPNPSDPTALSQNNATTFYRDSRGTLWIGTYGGGLNKYDTATGHFTRYTEANGLPNDIVYGILEDDYGRLWLSTNKGLSRFDPDEETFANFDVRDGLQSNEFNGGAALQLASGEFAFGGINGFNIFHPDSIQAGTYAPPVVLTSLQVNNEEKRPAATLPGLDAIRLPYQENFLAFEFAALDYTFPSKNQYAYRLDGIDADWVESGSRRFASYPNLPPGDYTLHVRGTNSDGHWSEATLALPLTIVPPFWMTGWFRAVLLLLVLGGVVGVVRYVSTRKLRRQVQALELTRKIQDERERISRDLHDHVGAQLSNIISLAELIKLSEKADEPARTKTYLASLDEDARLTMTQLRETIWALNQNAVTVSDFIAQVSDFARRRVRHRVRPALHFVEEGTMDRLLTPVQALNLYRIAQEGINNALKHADADNLTIALHANDADGFTLEIHDDGRFLTNGDAATVLHGNGLRNMERRAQELGGRVTLTPDAEAGTTVQVSVPV